MSQQENLEIYLNDHLAGSVGAVKTFQRLRRKVEDPRIVRLLTGLQHDVEADQDTLKNVMRRLEIGESRAKKMTAALAQKASTLKLRLWPSKHRQLDLLHLLDSLSIGIEGKKAMWTALAAGAESEPRLRVVSYDALVERADEQLTTLKNLRVEMAYQAFSDGTGIARRRAAAAARTSDHERQPSVRKKPRA